MTPASRLANSHESTRSTTPPIGLVNAHAVLPGTARNMRWTRVVPRCRQKRGNPAKRLTPFRRHRFVRGRRSIVQGRPNRASQGTASANWSEGYTEREQPLTLPREVLQLD